MKLTSTIIITVIGLLLPLTPAVECSIDPGLTDCTKDRGALKQYARDYCYKRETQPPLGVNVLQAVWEKPIQCISAFDDVIDACYTGFNKGFASSGSTTIEVAFCPSK